MHSPKPEMKKLYRSQRHKMIAGVCGGLAEYFGIDPTWVRVGTVILALFAGWAVILVYLVAAIIVPKAPSDGNTIHAREEGEHRSKAAYISGIALLAVGLLLVFSYFRILPWRVHAFWGVPWKLLWGLFLATIGIMLFISHQKRREEVAYTSSTSRREKRLVRVRQGRIIGGVCGGLAKYFEVDPSFIRLAWVLGTIASVGIGVLAYLVMLLLVPEESPVDSSSGTAA